MKLNNNQSLGIGKKNTLWAVASFINSYKFKKFKNLKKIIYMLSPKHGNMGDQAIAYASIKYLKENFNKYQIIEVSREDTFKYYKAIKNILNKDDIIILHGGGNMGNLYIQEEAARRFIIDKFKENPIISMTQTISFTDDEIGHAELEKSKKIYNSNKNLTILAREDESYKKMKKEFKNVKIIKKPDIVLYLENLKSPSNIERKYIMTCLRTDKESILKNKKEEIINTLIADYKNIYVYDTVVKKDVDFKNRNIELADIWQKFFNAKVVITDRLHGMIFCTITRTPCIVFKSLDHKVTEGYKWLKNLNYIKLTDDTSYENIKFLINELEGMTNINKTKFKEKYFNTLREEINL